MTDANGENRIVDFHGKPSSDDGVVAKSSRKSPLIDNWFTGIKIIMSLGSSDGSRYFSRRGRYFGKINEKKYNTNIIRLDQMRKLMLSSK